MSTEKKFKRRVRERMARTGESYTAARIALEHLEEALQRSLAILERLPAARVMPWPPAPTGAPLPRMRLATTGYRETALAPDPCPTCGHRGEPRA